MQGAEPKLLQGKPDDGEGAERGKGRDEAVDEAAELLSHVSVKEPLSKEELFPQYLMRWQRDYADDSQEAGLLEAASDLWTEVRHGGGSMAWHG